MTRGQSGVRGGSRGLSDDIVGIVLVVLLANVAVWQSFVSAPPFRILTALIFILFVPGYALVAALFPRRTTSPRTVGSSAQSLTDHDSTQRGQSDASRRFRGIDQWERLGLAFGLSLAITPLLALAVTLSPYSLSLTSIYVSLTAFTLVGLTIAVIRRYTLPPDERFHVSLRTWIAVDRNGQYRSLSTGQMVLNIALVGGILFAVGTLGFAVMASPDAEQFTDFSVLTENADGELVAGEYPDTLIAEEPQQIHTAIENEEGESVHYTVVVQLQRVEEADQGHVVAERVELDRFSVILDGGDSWTGARNLTVPETMTGTDMRMAFLLYRGEVPAETTSATAYRHLHLWFDVQSGPEAGSIEG